MKANHSKISQLIVLLLSLIASSAVYALSSDKDQPINLEADRADIDDKQGVSVYRGNVILSQGTMRLNAKELTLYHDKNHQLNKLIATGNPAKFKQRPDNKPTDMNASANKMVYYVKDDKIHLIGKAVLWQNQDSFHGNKIVYDTKAGTVKATSASKTTSSDGSSGRIRVTIQPANKKK